jgi:putative selenate reductase molybdopterin-binding subunit
VHQQEGDRIRGLYQPVPGGGFRGYGSSQTTFAIESAIDDLARLLRADPFEMRRKNMV